LCRYGTSFIHIASRWAGSEIAPSQAAGTTLFLPSSAHHTTALAFRQEEFAGVFNRGNYTIKSVKETTKTQKNISDLIIFA
jgi:hypothetical protein